MLYEELLNRAQQLAAGLPGEPIGQPDHAITAETVYPHAVRAVYRDQARTGKHLENITTNYLIETPNGEGVLPDGIFREYLDRAYLSNCPFAAKLPWEDFERYRFDRQMAYFAIRGSAVKWTGNVVSRPTCEATAGTQTITGDASAAEIGDRFYLYDATNGLVIDGAIKSISGTTSFTVHGKTLAATTEATEGIIYRGQEDVIVRSVNDMTVNTANQFAISATAAFTIDDVGRRLRVYTNPLDPTTGLITTQVADLIIDSVSANGTTATMRGKAASSGINQLADVMYSPFALQAIGIPAVPDALTDDLELTPEVAEDVIVRIASVLHGDVPLEALIAIGTYGYKK